jgi:hypothetical protein
MCRPRSPNPVTLACCTHRPLATTAVLLTLCANDAPIDRLVPQAYLKPSLMAITPRHRSCLLMVSQHHPLFLPFVATIQEDHLGTLEQL